MQYIGSAMSSGRRLRAQVNCDGGAIVDVYQKYSNVYSNIYELRGKELIEATSSVTEQRELAGKLSAEEPPASHAPAPAQQVAG